MEPAAVLIVVLSHQGYWFGGKAGTIEIRRNAETAMPVAELKWELDFGPTRIAGGRVAIRLADGAARIRLTPPVVRVRTTMRWSYELREKRTGREITRGARTIHVFPRTPLAATARRLSTKKLLVWDRDDGLPTVLAGSGVPFTRIADAAKLQLARADIILVGPDQIDPSPFGQTAFIGHAEAGSSVLVFAQRRLRRLGGYPLVRRAHPVNLAWRNEHPLFNDLETRDLQSWLTGPPSDLWAIQLPADEPVLEIAYWPRESPGKGPVPIDAVIVVKAVGAGRIVLCQLPLGAWEQDPRAQLFVASALAYLTTRPEPTPPPSQRLDVKSPEPTSVPTVVIPSGVTP